jgi:hypothetical protein
MSYDEFSDQLRKIRAEYEKIHGKPMETIEELIMMLDKKLSKPKSRGLKSLKGLSL